MRGTTGEGGKLGRLRRIDLVGPARSRGAGSGGSKTEPHLFLFQVSRNFAAPC